MTAVAPPPLRGTSVLRHGVETFFPGYFAMVMATGIVSVASHMTGRPGLAHALFTLNLGFYAVLWAITAARLVRYPGRVYADLADHVRGPGFFTIIAGTCVLGNQYLLIGGQRAPALALWWLAVVLGAAMIYTFAAAMTTRPDTPGLDKGLHGGWLMLTVASQAVSLLGTSLASGFSHPEMVYLFTLSLYLIGGMFYIMLISLIFYRWMFFRMEPAQFTPLYWVNMGAVAITTRAGLALVQHGMKGEWDVLTEITPFLKGFTLFFWAMATWWIPLLTILMVWKHVVKRASARYEPQFWGTVFTLGMYTSCTYELVHTLGLSFLAFVPDNFIYIALAAWTAVFVGLAASLVRGAKEVF